MGEPRSGRMFRRPIAWVLGAVALLMIVALVVPIVSVLQPRYYERYPELGARMRHWETSTHSRISCIECHVEPGAGGALSFARDAVPAFYAQLLTGPSDTNLLSAPSRAACQKCHTTYRKVGPGGDLLIPHRAHVEVLGIECTDCHENLVHSFNRRGFNRPEMEGCLERCHDGDAAGDECVDCHTRKGTPASHRQADWLRQHGAAAESQECGECHDWTPNYCADCHAQRPASHAGNWKKGHAPHAKIRGDGCLVCHGKPFCEECH
ncbi:MAG: cytochrome c3 family protein [Coriobacteriia bacterium]|nr:cytochrome c3 family protein [Coriobacteriia bacterium]